MCAFLIENEKYVHMGLSDCIESIWAKLNLCLNASSHQSIKVSLKDLYVFPKALINYSGR